MTRVQCKHIGLTGGIGSGKTTAANYFTALGVPVISADEISRNALTKDGACYDRVIETFGMDILLDDGTIDRKALADFIFSDQTKRRALNEIVHPYVIATMFERANALRQDQKSTIILFDVPLLFESGMDRDMDANILVVCDEETRIHRIMDRDGTTRKLAKARIQSQLPEEEKRARADYILDNNFSQSHLKKQVAALYKKLMESANATDV